MTRVLTQHGDDTLLRVKAVPNASRDEIAGLIGDRLKIRIAAPPEGGRANEAIRRLLAGVVDIPRRDISIVSGDHSAEKTFRLTGTRVSAVAAALPLTR